MGPWEEVNVEYKEEEDANPSQLGSGRKIF